jgi:hypothetical protein
MDNYFLNKTFIIQDIRARIDTWDCIRFKKFCKGNNFQNQETIHIIGENLLKLFVRQRINIQNVRMQEIKHQKNNPVNKLANELNSSQKYKWLINT